MLLHFNAFLIGIRAIAKMSERRCNNHVWNPSRNLALRVSSYSIPDLGGRS
ncbi:hypothetical protein V1291_003682 [Nitrobacteraceae bacterium AZCC 1564]